MASKMPLTEYRTIADFRTAIHAKINPDAKQPEQLGDAWAPEIHLTGIFPWLELPTREWKAAIPPWNTLLALLDMYGPLVDAYCLGQSLVPHSYSLELQFNNPRISSLVLATTRHM